MKVLNYINTVNKHYLTVSLLGKVYKLEVKYRNNPIVELDKEDAKIFIYLPKKYKEMNNTEILNMAIEKMYDEIAEEEIADSMEKIRIILEFAPEDYMLTRMNDSFCKCIRNKIIKINPDIVKYNKKIIEISLIQAFCETMYKKDTEEFKDLLQYAVEKYEKLNNKLIKIINITDRVRKVS